MEIKAVLLQLGKGKNLDKKLNPHSLNRRTRKTIDSICHQKD
jgi:hypothetical protein